MSWWTYLLLAACYRGAAWLLGETAGYVVGGTILAGVLAYWARRAWLALKDRRERRKAACLSSGPTPG
jgi:hypothetical protein